MFHGLLSDINTAVRLLEEAGYGVNLHYDEYGKFIEAREYPL